jgi:hypothetical protein
MKIEEFEAEIVRALLSGEDPLLAALRDQYAASSVRDRELNATGFVTRFDIPASVPTVPRKHLHLDDLQVQIAGAATPADTSVHVHNGRLKSLECFVYEGRFPEAPEIEAAWFYGTERYPAINDDLLSERDLEELLDEDDE